MTTAASDAAGNPLANIGIFALFVVITLYVVVRASQRNATAAEFFTGGRAFSGPQNGIAISGDYLSAASFLGIACAIAVYGYDGFLYSIGFLVAWLVALLLVAELLRNTGKFTMADVLSFRLEQRPVGWPRPPTPWPCRCSTCWRRWPAPAPWSRCFSTSRAESVRAS